MNTKIFTTFPQEAKDIRIEVFVKEQGFKNEFDEIDTISHHIVAFDEGNPSAHVVSSKKTIITLLEG